MCPPSVRQFKAYYVAEEVTEIELPSHLQDLPQLGDIEETGIIGYVIIANGEEITIIANEQEYLAYMQQQPPNHLYFQAMASDVLRVKLRIMNNIYNVSMAPSALTDVLLKGMESVTVKAIKRSNAESVVTGKFANEVEVLSAINQSDVSGVNNQQQEETMEIEVKIYTT